MSRASSHALKHPPVTAPSEPAGVPSPFPELAVAIERERRRGRGAQSNDSGRFEAEARVAFDDGWQSLDDLPPFKTTVALDTARKVITRNNSPDIGFDRSINPYRGCEHGCVYCFARPTHAYLGLSPGLDFESKLYAKPDAPQLLEKELAAQDYEPRMIAIGTNTDPYQPIERERKIMRGILEVLERAGHPVGIVTKSALVTRDIDILSRMAKRNLAKVALSVTTLDAETGAHHGAAGLDAGQAAGSAAAIVGGGNSDHRDGRACHPRAERFRDRAHSRCRLSCRRQGSELCAAAAAARGARPLPRMADGELSRPLPPRLHPDPRHARRARLQFAVGNPDEGHRADGLDDRARFEIACEKLGLNKRRSKLTTIISPGRSAAASS